MTNINLITVLLLGGLLLSACKPSTPPAVPRPAAEPAQLARGELLFKQHCAACHGVRAQGAPDWQQPGPNGKYPAPPLDGSGHDWHHPTAALKDTIRHGTQRIGGSMPPWRDTLSEDDITAVIAWFQSLWPAEIYRAWDDIDRRARSKAAEQ